MRYLEILEDPSMDEELSMDLTASQMNETTTAVTDQNTTSNTTASAFTDPSLNEEVEVNMNLGESQMNETTAVTDHNSTSDTTYSPSTEPSSEDINK